MKPYSNKMKNNLLLYILLAFLMVVNGFFIYKNLKGPDKRKHRSPRNFISSQLDFSPEQLDQFKSLEQAHRDRIRWHVEQIDYRQDRMDELQAMILAKGNPLH